MHVELIYSNGVALRTGDGAIREVNPRKRLTRQERDEHEAARLIFDLLAEHPSGRLVVFNREGFPAAVVLGADHYAELVGWHA